MCAMHSDCASKCSARCFSDRLKRKGANLYKWCSWWWEDRNVIEADSIKGGMELWLGRVLSQNYEV